VWEASLPKASGSPDCCVLTFHALSVKVQPTQDLTPLVSVSQTLARISTPGGLVEAQGWARPPEFLVQYIWGDPENLEI